MTKAIAAALASLALVPAGASAATVEGPLSGGVRGGNPMNSTLVPVEPEGYVEEEYLVSGDATKLAGASNDTRIPFTPVAIPAQPTEDVEPYATRIIVRRPVDPADFNGTLFVDWNNVTLQTDFDSLWGVSNDLLMERGYAYVAVSAQKQGVDNSPMALKEWDPVRYAKVSHPGDAFSWDIFAQAAQAALSCDAGSPCPLGGLTPRHVIATGASQSATYMRTFINEFQPRTELFDGYLPQVMGVQDVRDDLVPILWVNSETEARSVSQTDSGRYYRYWEIAGAMHGDIRQAAYLVATIARDQAAPAPVPAGVPYASYNPAEWEQYGERDPGGSCPKHFMPSRYAVNAAVIAIDRWVRTGKKPARVPPFERDAAGAVVRDEHDNIRGGLRLPPMEVPIAAYVGNECQLIGRTTQFDGATLAALYPTHEDYVAKMRAATDEAVADRIMLRADGEKLMALVEASSIPEPSPFTARLPPLPIMRAG